MTAIDWNNLSIEVRCAPSLNAFKAILKKISYYRSNNVYSHGNRTGRINHTRIRLGLSGLNGHRFEFNFIDHSNCPKCDYHYEDALHYFFDCVAYNEERKQLLIGIRNIICPGIHYSLVIPDRVNENIYLLNNLLHGSVELSFVDNIKLFEIVQKFICETKRFE